MRKFIKKFKNSIIGKILKALWKILWLILEIIIIFIAIVIVTQRISKNEKAFLGFRIFSVATGSMEPEYAVGDILISREKDPSEIVVGDNIVYLGMVADYRGKIITHNVIEVEQNEEGDYLFHTKGFANNIEDPVVHEDQLYGVIFYNNEFLAFLCKILTNRYGLYCFVVVLIIYFFIGFVRNQGERMEQEREQEREIREKQRRTQNRKKIQDEEETIPLLEEKTKKKTARKVEEQEEIKSTRKTAIAKKKAEQEEPVKEKKKTTDRKVSSTKKNTESEEIKAIKSTKKKDDSQTGTVESKKTTRAKKEE